MAATQPEQNGGSKRRRLGQVFTPRGVADWMARWACAHRPARILDPALGRGVFVEAIDAFFAESFNGHPRPRVDGFDVDAELLRSNERRACVSVRLFRRDFITAHIRGTYDAVVANPPYICHRGMDYDEGVLRRLDRLAGCRLSRMTNIYGLFLVKILSLLAPGGRAAVITPAEWLNADFGRAIKAHLLRENAIEAILHFDHGELVFDEVLTTAAITLLRRDRPEHEPVTLLTVGEGESLDTVDPARGRRLGRDELNPDRKWTPLFSTEPDVGLRPGPTLGEIGRCTRGIATGANQYFALRESDRRRHGLDHRDLAFCITKARQVAGNSLTQADLDRLVQEDERVYLLHPRRRLTSAVRSYLQEGERLGIPRRYLPAHRPVWYMPETRAPAPIWVSVFARGAFRFVRNRAGARNLTAFHGIYLHEPTPACVDALFAYLNSEAAQARLRQHRRIYADGLLKVEPRDVEALPIPPALLSLCRPAKAGVARTPAIRSRRQ